MPLCCLVLVCNRHYMAAVNVVFDVHARQRGKAAPAQTEEAGAQVEMMSPPGAAMSTALRVSRTRSVSHLEATDKHTTAFCSAHVPATVSGCKVVNLSPTEQLQLAVRGVYVM